jgi:hypothetical protein
MRIADGFERACAVAVEHLDGISDEVAFSKENTENLLKTAMTSLGSKMYDKLRIALPLLRLISLHLVFRKHIPSLRKSLSTQSCLLPILSDVTCPST